ncbi:MAG TPA: four helix bundle protein [Polyangiaceae bacterium]|nr:four helix bundle protein [Polyangiaceae bacterium]
MHDDRPTATLPALVEHGYEVWLWIDARVAGFPVQARRMLGHRIVDAALDALTATTEAAYLPRGLARVARLDCANRSLTVLRILLRGARDRKHLSVEQHEHVMNLVDDWGRQIGGWLRAERGRPGHG